ncbi:MAG TPA: hypothetical protein PLE48_07245 [Thiobacillus sp.]|nr:MAG: hypothetical protein B7Y50_10320 [Hydrogenophilales bacterium 28-61-11]OYZ56204.1 MAG: hypothetical protein B7Y21_12425 [Hydrogenophilales bacterium 16-61-112]OZA44671.1 MAG: hypothetical protein B7X81_09725 [Hydrogenophilales bacterium 17-61-76]HQT29662.1 hypothetical protein [Thiobacillus sp.]HQT70202.1 hypothetical protein [Thiobacillus sp.]
MRTPFHRLLLIVLMLLLPLQTFAASSILGCMRDPAAAQLDPVPMSMAACHEPDPAESAPTPHDCAHCAACVLASALPISLASPLKLMSTRQHYTAQPIAAFNGFIPASLERPPRLSLA